MIDKNFYKLKVAKVEKSTPDCTLVTFEINPAIMEKFQFSAGQHLTLKKQIGGSETRRTYSLCVSPDENKWQIGVKKIQGGLFSTYINENLAEGDEIEVMPPSGQFTRNAITKDSVQYNIAFAAGSGITPIMSIIKHDLGSNPDTRFQLFYINKSLNSVILKEELEALKNNHLNRFEIYYFFTREKRDIELYNGRIDKNKLDILSEKIIDLKQLDNIYLCGPKAMIFDLKGYFHNKGIDKNKIHFELFYTGDEPSTEQFISHQKQNGQDFEITLKEGGKSFDYTIASGTTLLDGALQHQANLPFACKGGVCATCRTKLVEGEVEMIQNYALEKDEIDAGYILACQSLPISKHIVIDFDQ